MRKVHLPLKCKITKKWFLPHLFIKDIKIKDKDKETEIKTETETETDMFTVGVLMH